MKTGRSVGAAFGLLALATIAAACGGSSSKTSNTPAAGTTPSAATTVAATKPAAAATSAATNAPTASSTKRTQVDSLNVTAKDFSFTLNLTSIHPGAPGVDVFFENKGSTTHTIAFYEDSGHTKKIAEAQPVAAGASSGFPFIPPTGAKSVFYRCEIHPTQMFGELPVTP